MKDKLRQRETQNDIWMVIQIVIVSTLAYLAGYNLTYLLHLPTAAIGGLWAGISAVIVIENSPKKTRNSALQRIIGSFIGAVLSGLYLFFLPFSVAGYALCMGAGALTCYLIRLPIHTRLTGVTISVVMIVSTISQDINPLMNAKLTLRRIVSGLDHGDPCGLYPAWAPDSLPVADGCNETDGSKEVLGKWGIRI
jgi:uncharacterized membrane protein YgaE (UPF0421/DUF939 family)